MPHDCPLGGPESFTGIGVHFHPPQAFLRQGDIDQEVLDEITQEKQAMHAEMMRGAGPGSSGTGESGDGKLTGSPVGMCNRL